MSNPAAIVTVGGKSSGMGTACAYELAEQDHHLVLMARSDSVIELAKDLGGVALTDSLTEPNDLERLVKLTLDNYGRIDAVVNNIGPSARGELLQLTDQEWHVGVDLIIAKCNPVW